jgi:hypothetical protein
MRGKTDESPGIKSKMDDVAAAVAAVKRDLIDELPKQRHPQPPPGPLVTSRGPPS